MKLIDVTSRLWAFSLCRVFIKSLGGYHYLFSGMPCDLPETLYNFDVCEIAPAGQDALNIYVCE